MTAAPRDDLVHRIAGEITLLDGPDATSQKWWTNLDISQTMLIEQLDVSLPVVSDYESDRRESLDISVIRRMVEALLDIGETRGSSHIRQYARVLSAGFKSDIIQDPREYPMSIPFSSFYDTIGVTPIADGDQDRISGHIIINSIQVIMRLSPEGLYRLYGQSTSRTLVFTGVTHGESPLATAHVITLTPSAVVLHGLSKDDLWRHAPALAAIDDSALAVTDHDLDEMLEDLRKLP